MCHANEKKAKFGSTDGTVCRLVGPGAGRDAGPLAGSGALLQDPVGRGGLREGAVYGGDGCRQSGHAPHCHGAGAGRHGGGHGEGPELDLRNVFFVDIDVARIEDCFAPGELDGMYINFCDPWPRKKNAKRRLTHRGFFEKYSRVLTPGGQIHFKTDNAPLFQFSLEEFQALGFPVQAVTWNLHENGPVGIMTDYEEKFYTLGTPIHRCEVTLHPIEATEPAYEKSEDGENSAEERGEA